MFLGIRKFLCAESYRNFSEKAFSYHENFLDFLELCRRVDLVGHDVLDGPFRLAHRLEELGGPRVVDILDEGVVLLPESHLDEVGLDVRSK